jgi:hypothetical protein
MWVETKESRDISLERRREEETKQNRVTAQGMQINTL